jgi:ATP-binding cassette subfamily F protein uup
VALARLLRQSANLLVLDEPTNDLDVPTLGALESMLVDCGATVLIVTHDRWLLDRVATSLMVWSPDETKVTIHAGNFSTYRRLQAQTKNESDARTEAPPRRESTKPEVTRAVKTKSLNFAEKRELEALLPAIDAAEKSVFALQARLSNPATYADGGKEVSALQAALEAEKAEVERLMARWEELESKRAN